MPDWHMVRPGDAPKPPTALVPETSILGSQLHMFLIHICVVNVGRFLGSSWKAEVGGLDVCWVALGKLLEGWRLEAWMFVGWL